MQHSIGLLSLLAPYDFINGITTNYIASSFTEDDIGKYRCISYPFVDSELKMGATECFHDGFSFSRIKKIQNIVNYVEKSKTSFPLKVCFNPRNGENCCKCEKCLRTMAMIKIAGGDVNKLGFDPDYKNIGKYIKSFCDRTILKGSILSHWIKIQSFGKQMELTDSSFKWLQNYKFNTYVEKWYSTYFLKMRIFLGNIRHILHKKGKK